MEISCPLCGRSSEDVRFVGQFCIDCTIKKLRNQIGKNLSADIDLCKFCGKIRNGLDYSKLGKHSLEFALRSQLKHKDCTLNVLSFTNESCEVLWNCDVDGEKVSFTDTIQLKMNTIMCPTCSRKKAGYYEALVQIRGELPQAKRILGSLERFIKRRGGFISKIEEDPKGYDVYTSDKKATSEFFLVMRLKPKRSYTLYGMKKGKKLYRNIYSIKL